MSENATMDRVARGFEVVVVRIMQLLLMVITATATVVLVILTWRALRASPGSDIASTEELHQAVQRGFAGVLVILLGLELLDSLKTYFTAHRIGAEVILTVALIAVGRHIIQIDFDHTAPTLLLGLGGLMLALTLGLFLMKKAGIGERGAGG